MQKTKIPSRIEMRDHKSPIEKLTYLADILADGHYTIMKFTTNYRVCLRTFFGTDSVEEMSVGSTMDEAINSLISKISKEGSVWFSSKNKEEKE